jgi:hypothetical protein
VLYRSIGRTFLFDVRRPRRVAPSTLLRGVNRDDILSALEGVQPYLDVVGAPQEPAHSPLWQLTRLNNIDKHREVLLIVAAVDVDEMWWSLPADVESPKVRINTGPLAEGSPIAWFKFNEADAPSGFDPHPSVRVVVREFELGRLMCVPVANLLDTYCWWVETHIVECRSGSSSHDLRFGSPLMSVRQFGLHVEESLFGFGGVDALRLRVRDLGLSLR